MDRITMVLTVRDTQDNATQDSATSGLTFKLLITLLVLALVSIVSLILLFVVRRIRVNRRKDILPVYNEYPLPNTHQMESSKEDAEYHNSADDASYNVRSEKQDLLPPRRQSRAPGNLPQIRVHHPEEFDDTGLQSPGRVVSVRVGEAEAGRDLDHEDLPAYEAKVGGETDKNEGSHERG